MNSTKPTFRVITVKFAARCAETKRYIMAGTKALFNPSSKKLYHLSSNQYQSFIYSSIKS